MPALKLQVKPTAGGDKFYVEIESDITVAELKEEVAKHCPLAAAEQRLIYKGQILKDERTVDSYGIVTDHVLHLVRGRPASTPPAPSPAAAAAAPSPMGMGGGFSAGMGGAFPGNPQQFEEMASQMMGSPMIQQLLNNPELMRTMMQSNPAVRQIIDQHPEMAQIFNNPQILRESLQIAANPSLMREHMRNTDRAMSNMELHPEGFNMLRRVYEDIQQPLMNAANSPSDASTQNPLAALFPNPPATTTAPASTPASAAAATPASAPLNTEPLPNPWAAAASGGGNAAGGGLGAIGALGGLSGMGGGFPAGMGNPAEMLQDPMMQSMMSSLMSNPQFMESMINSNPMLRNMADANPQVREVLGNPEMLQQMMAPENLAAMGQMQQLMQNNPMLRSLMMGPAAGGAAGGLGGAAGQPAAAGMPDMAALMNMMGGMGGGMGAGFGAPAAPAPVADPGTHYATQLQQLQDMGFYDRDSNIRALQQTGGNVNAAVDRLLGGV